MKIYKATCKINGKGYIGKTTKSLKIRIREHINLSKNKAKYLFHKALRKYGPENFTWEVIVNCGDNQHLLNESEIFFIDRYNTKVPNGYNLTDGGEGQNGWHPTEENRKNMSAARMGKSPWNKGKSGESCKSLSEAKKGEKHPMYGKHQTSEWKRKIGIANKGKKKPPRSEEHCEKISIAHRGVPLSNETKMKISMAHKGKILSAEHRMKMSESQKKRRENENLWEY